MRWLQRRCSQCGRCLAQGGHRPEAIARRSSGDEAANVPLSPCKDVTSESRGERGGRHGGETGTGTGTGTGTSCGPRGLDEIDIEHFGDDMIAATIRDEMNMPQLDAVAEDVNTIRSSVRGLSKRLDDQHELIAKVLNSVQVCRG